MAVHTELGTPSEWSTDGKQDNQEHNQPEIACFTSPASAFSSAVENTKAQTRCQKAASSRLDAIFVLSIVVCKGGERATRATPFAQAWGKRASRKRERAREGEGQQVSR